MNKKIWRKDREIMVFVNSAGHHLLSAMDGECVFSKLVEKAFVSKIADLTRFKVFDLDSFSEVVEFEDRFLQSTAFTVALWSRGFIDFSFNLQDIGTMTTSQLLKKICDKKKSLTVNNVLGELSYSYKEDFLKLHLAFHKEQGNIMALLNHDVLLPTFTGETEYFEKSEVLPESISPRYRIGYVKPSLMEKIENVHENIGKSAGCALVAIAAGGIAIYETAVVWDKTVSQECGTNNG
jgi:hypothetical protein